MEKINKGIWISALIIFFSFIGLRFQLGGPDFVFFFTLGVPLGTILLIIFLLSSKNKEPEELLLKPVSIYKKTIKIILVVLIIVVVLVYFYKLFTSFFGLLGSFWEG